MPLHEELEHAAPGKDAFPVLVAEAHAKFEFLEHVHDLADDVVGIAEGFSPEMKLRIVRVAMDSEMNISVLLGKISLFGTTTEVAAPG